MECKLDNITIHYQAFGEGKPILMLHGAPLDHRALLGCMEPIFRHRAGWLRIYPDLPGMGRTKGVNWIASVDQMLEVVLKFIDRVIPDQSFPLVGHSYAGYLARGIIYQRRQAVNGLFLLVPWIKYDRKERSVPEKMILVEDPTLLGQLDPDEAEGFAFGAVVQNQKNWERYRREWLPGILAHDPQFFAQMLERSGFSFDVDTLSEPFVKPTLILTGNQDHISGYRNSRDILENYPIQGADVMTSQPRWQLNEMQQLTVEYTSLAEVQAYDARRQQIMSIQKIQAEYELFFQLAELAAV